MSKVRHIEMPRKSGPVLFSDAVIFGDTMIISGMLPTDSDGKLVGEGDAAAQADQVFQNIQAVLEKVGADFTDVVKLTIYLTDINVRPLISPVRQRYCSETKPASTLVEISRLALPGALMEIEATVYMGE